MKRITLFMILLVTVLHHSSQAQKFHLGVKAGANVNKLSALSFKDGFSFGYQAGAFSEIGLGKKFAIQPEVLFSQTNLDTSKLISSIYTINNVSSIQLNYICIPVYLSYRLSKVLALQAGPQYGILIDKSKTLLANGKDAFKTGDFSLIGGVQFSFSGFRLYGRYAVGLSNINDVDNRDKWKSQSIQVGIGYAIL